MKNIRQWFRNAVLVLAGVMLLAACGNSAKADLQAIAKVMVDTGYTPAKKPGIPTAFATSEIRSRKQGDYW